MGQAIDAVLAGTKGFAVALLAPLTARIGNRPRVAGDPNQVLGLCSGPAALAVVEFTGEGSLPSIQALVRDGRGLRIVAGVPAAHSGAEGTLRALGVEVGRWDGKTDGVISAVERAVAAMSGPPAEAPRARPAAPPPVAPAPAAAKPAARPAPAPTIVPAAAPRPPQAAPPRPAPGAPAAAAPARPAASPGAPTGPRPAAPPAARPAAPAAAASAPRPPAAAPAKTAAAAPPTAARPPTPSSPRIAAAPAAPADPPPPQLSRSPEPRPAPAAAAAPRPPTVAPPRVAPAPAPSAAAAPQPARAPANFFDDLDADVNVNVDVGDFAPAPSSPPVDFHAPGVYVPPAADPAARKWPSTVSTSAQAEEALQRAVQGAADPSRPLHALALKTLDTFSDFERSVLAGEPQPFDAAPVRKAAVIRLRVAEGLASVPPAGSAVDAAALSAILAEIDGLLAEVSPLMSSAPAELQPALEAIRNGLVREAIDFSEAAARVNVAAPSPPAAAPRAAPVRGTRVLSVGAEAEPERSGKQWKLVAVLVIAVLAAVGYHGYRRFVAKGTVLPPTAVSNAPRNLQGVDAGKAATVLVPSGKVNQAELDRFKEQQEQQGKQVLERNGTVVVLPAPAR